MDDFEKLVSDERNRQEDKWGEQNHIYPIWRIILGEELGEADKAFLEYRFGHGDTKPIGKELIHSAAVIKAMYESFVRNGWIST